MRVCPKCKKELNENLFWKNQSACILCQKKAWAERKEKGRYREKQREKEHNDILYGLLRYAKRRAKRLGREFTIKKEDIELVHVCPILGVELVKHRGKLAMNSYSLDRVDNSKGYVPGNVRVISFKANQLKENLTLEQARNLVKYMENKD